MAKHKMDYDPDNQIFSCPICGRMVKLRPFEILVTGNQQADHTVLYGMTMQVDTEQTNLDPDVWEW